MESIPHIHLQFRHIHTLLLLLYRPLIYTLTFCGTRYKYKLYLFWGVHDKRTIPCIAGSDCDFLDSNLRDCWVRLIKKPGCRSPSGSFPHSTGISHKLVLVTSHCIWCLVIIIFAQYLKFIPSWLLWGIASNLGKTGVAKWHTLSTNSASPVPNYRAVHCLVMAILSERFSISWLCGPWYRVHFYEQKWLW